VSEELLMAQWLRRLTVVALVAVLVLLAFQVLQPFIVPVIWAGILAYVTWPVHEWLVRQFGGRRVPAALVMTLLLSAAIILPLFWLAILIKTEALPFYRELGPALANVVLPDYVRNLPLVGPKLQSWLEQIARDPGSIDLAVKSFFDQSSGQLTAVFGGVGRNITKLALALISLFFMYRDGDEVTVQVNHALQRFFGEVRVEHYLSAVGGTVKAVVYGLVLAALAQATLAGLGYWVAGLPAPVLFAALTFLVGLIPFAIPFMWSGASLWLFLNGDPVAAAGLFIWGATAVSWIDNVVRPLVISGATQIPFLLVLFGVLGGLAAFGLVGLFIGPVVLAVIMTVWREWNAERRAMRPREN
jgi:predicted PurR-regulated permease PerM